MESEQRLAWELEQRLWHELEAAAAGQLQETPEPSLSKSQKLLRLEIHPSFGNPRVWTLYGPHPSSHLLAAPEPQRYEACWTVWQQSADRERCKELLTDQITRLRYRLGKLEPLRPEIEVLRLEPAAFDLEPVLMGLQHVTIPFSPPEPNAQGLDGTNFTLEMWKGMWSSRLSWWSDQPATWKPLHDATRALLEVLGDDYGA